jgi:hypothetical protein
MNPCQNCGRINAAEANFCRFCGTRFGVRQPVVPDPFDHAAPRPYAWKTDEFQAQQSPKGTVPIDGRVQNVTSAFTPPANYHAAPLAFQGAQYPSQPFRCPRCMSQYLPRMERRVSTAGWITFAVLLVFFFPLFWIGLLIKEEVPVCQTCNSKVG